MGIANLQEELFEARIENDIYSIARLVMILTSGGVKETLTPEELRGLNEQLAAARMGVSHLSPALKSGYALARWLLLDQYFNRSPLLVSESELQDIEAAGRAYGEENNLYQVASLLFTCERLGLSLSIPLTISQREEVKKIMTTMR
ncbi:MAG TPA: hypothetical protein VGE31_02190 [Candidatus Paceibacterota bacterium]